MGIVLLVLALVAPGRSDGTRPPVLVVIGAPGAGKNLPARRLSEARQLPLVSTSELLNAEAARGTYLGRQIAAAMFYGDLVNPQVVDRLVAQRLDRPDCLRGVVIVGYPRTLEQARFLDQLLAARGLAPATIVLLDAPDWVLLARLAARAGSYPRPSVSLRQIAIARMQVFSLFGYYLGRDLRVIRADDPPEEIYRQLEETFPGKR